MPTVHSSNKPASPDLRTVQRILAQNRRQFLRYNAYRKEVFSELAPDDSDVICRLLPWLFSINHPDCPGYVDGLETSFRVFGVDSPAGRREEAEFKKRFGVTTAGSLITGGRIHCRIEGLYTIGSVGSVSQTDESDCDIWLCIDRREFRSGAWRHLNEKVNLIKDWLDANLRMPVYFFVSDLAAIRACRFGSVDAESSGSTQQHVLKEEFYRSCMVIAGKIPLWWVCHHPTVPVDYAMACKAATADDFWEYDLIDMGDVARIEQKEYFGAALWQIRKSLHFPLKSIVKMGLLQVLLLSEDAELMCHRFRAQVLSADPDNGFSDYSVFTMLRILDVYGERKPEWVQFLAECMYIRCQLNPYNYHHKRKNQLAAPLLKRMTLSRERQAHLRRSGQWHYQEQLALGDRLFKLLLEIYRDMASDYSGLITESDRRDLTILGRKISAFYMKKRNKIRIYQKPTGRLNLSDMSFSLDRTGWHVFSGNDQTHPLVSSRNILHAIAFVVWNGLFAVNRIRMRPNSSSMTHGEIVNLGRQIGQWFGTYGSLDLPYGNYLTDECITHILVVVGLEKSPWYKETIDIGVVYQNNWGELFARRFTSVKAYDVFLNEAVSDGHAVGLSTYVLRSATAYEKIIERTKQRVAQTIGGAGSPPVGDMGETADR